MTDKKTTKTEKQAEKKQPTELQDVDLDKAQGGVANALVAQGTPDEEADGVDNREPLASSWATR